MFAIRSCYQAWAPNHGPYGECTSQPQLMLLLMRQRRRRRAQDRLLALPNPICRVGPQRHRDWDRGKRAFFDGRGGGGDGPRGGGDGGGGGAVVHAGAPDDGGFSRMKPGSRRPRLR